MMMAMIWLFFQEFQGELQNMRTWTLQVKNLNNSIHHLGCWMAIDDWEIHILFPQTTSGDNWESYSRPWQDGKATSGLNFGCTVLTPWFLSDNLKLLPLLYLSGDTSQAVSGPSLTNRCSHTLYNPQSTVDLITLENFDQKLIILDKQWIIFDQELTELR